MWTPRFLVLTDEMIGVYKTVPSNNQQPLLSGKLILSLIENTENIDPIRKNCFILKINAKIIFLSCETINEKNNWMNAFNALLLERINNDEVSFFNCKYGNNDSVLEVSKSGICLKNEWNFPFNQLRSFQISKNNFEFEFSEKKIVHINTVSECTNCIRNIMLSGLLKQKNIRYSAELLEE